MPVRGSERFGRTETAVLDTRGGFGGRGRWSGTTGAGTQGRTGTVDPGTRGASTDGGGGRGRRARARRGGLRRSRGGGVARTRAGFAGGGDAGGRGRLLRFRARRAWGRRSRLRRARARRGVEVASPVTGRRDRGGGGGLPGRGVPGAGASALVPAAGKLVAGMRRRHFRAGLGRAQGRGIGCARRKGTPVQGAGSEQVGYGDARSVSPMRGRAVGSARRGRHPPVSGTRITATAPVQTRGTMKRRRVSS